jgi:hypothetical protein
VKDTKDANEEAIKAIILESLVLKGAHAPPDWTQTLAVQIALL